MSNPLPISPSLPSPQEAPIAVVDVETTGLIPLPRPNQPAHEIVSLAIILCDVALRPVLTVSHFVSPERPHSIDPQSAIISGYLGHEHLWKDAITQEQCARIISSYTRDRCLLAHNVDFDRGFLAASMRLIKESPRWKARQICTLKAMREALRKGLVRGEGASLQASCARFGIHLPREEGAAHFALDDAEATRQLAQTLVKLGALRIV